MSSTIVLINLLGAVALLLFGLAQVKSGVIQAFGARLRSILATGTRNNLRSFLSGLVATLALQSSTATALTTASFVERDMIRPRMAQVVLLGANVGTALTAWVIATGVAWLSPLLLFAGLVLQRTKSGARQGGGTALVGIGLMLLSLHLLQSATGPMRESAALSAFLGLLENAWPVALLISAAIAAAASSSLAAVVLILSLASTGLLSPGLVVALVLGANLGGAIPPVLATLAAPLPARRLTIGNFIVRAIGCALALPLATVYAAPFASLWSPAGLPVDIHLAFNIVLALLAWPFSKHLSLMMEKLLPSTAKPEAERSFLDPDALSQPVVALANATREVLAVGDRIERMLIRSENALKHDDLAPLAEITKLEQRVDSVQQAVKIYLSRLTAAGLDAEHSRQAFTIIDYAINLEHMGDIIETGLCTQLRKKISGGLHFSPAGAAEIAELFDLTIDNMRIAQTIFVTRDFSLARQLMELKVEVRRMEKTSAERHIERLRDSRPESLRTSSLHLDMLRDLKRINAHIVSVAHPILDDNGLLGDSRLRKSEG